MALTCINLGTNLRPTELTERVGREENNLVGFLLWPPTWLKILVYKPRENLFR